MKYPLTKGLMIRKIKDLPLFWYVYKLYTEQIFNRRLIPMQKSAENVFSSIYENNDWKSDESRSGPGSTLDHTRAIVKKLPEFLKKHGVHSMLDAPCGDFNWMKHVDKKDIRYIGGDIVKELVKANNLQYGTDKISFVQLDIIKDSLPDVDLIFMRDCLVHFSNENITRFFKNLISSNIKYLLTTNFPLTRHNFDISMGNFRFINLLRKPYNLPKEEDILWEDSIEYNGQCPDKSLYLWDVDKIRNHMNG